MENEIRIKNGFPDYLRAFARDRISLAVEQYGGWDGLRLVRVEEKNGFPISDQEHIPIFDRLGNFDSIRPLLGPAIRFLGEEKNLRCHPFEPQKGSIAPNGFKMRCSRDGFQGKYSLELQGERVAAEFQWKGEKRKNFQILFSKVHLCDRERYSSFNAIIGDAEAKTPHELIFDADPGKPFPSGNVRIKPRSLTFSPEKNALIYSCTLHYPSWERTLWMVLTSSAPLAARETQNQWILSAPWEKRTKIKVALALSEESEEAACKEAFKALKEPLFRKLAGETEKIASTSPFLEIRGMKEIRDFVRLVPHYQDSMLVYKDEDYASIRSSSWRYGACITWDHTIPIRDFLLSRQWETAEKMLRYQINYPWICCSLLTLPQVICMLHEYISFTGNMAILKEFRDKLLLFMEYTDRLRDPGSGLVLFSRSYGVDILNELNLESPFYDPGINGIYFGAFRCLGNLASDAGEEALAKEAWERADALEKSYQKVFYSEKAHYLYTGINRDFSKPAENVPFMCVVTIPMHFAQGEYLFRKMIHQLAEFQAERLYHPMGRVAQPYDSSGNENWRCVHMNQHLFHQALTARIGGRVEEAYRIIRGYMGTFAQYKTAIETFNLNGCNGNVQQTSPWQTFSGSSVYSAAIIALAGIHWHRGGLCYIPADDDREIRFRNLSFRDHIFDFHIRGTGKFVEKILINGEELKGSLQLPGKLPQGRILCEIFRSRELSRPVLVCGYDLAVKVEESSPARLLFRAENRARSYVKLLSPSRPEVRKNGEEIPIEWDEKNHLAFMDVQFEKEDCVEVNMMEKQKKEIGYEEV